ncbi:MAG: aminoacyl-tRNA hydrolase [Bacillota bacterium]
MRLIAGLGNPGKDYEATRHNVGFMVADLLADKWGIEFSKTKEKGLVAEGYHQGEKIILVKPQTYMNLSGRCVSPLVNYYKIAINKVIVIYDDLDLPLGVLRIRPGGASGGHKGIQSIMDHLGTMDIPRVKIGIGRPPSDSVDHVLGVFSEEEWEITKKVLLKSVEAVEKMLDEDIEKVMNIYNRNYRG